MRSQGHQACRTAVADTRLPDPPILRIVGSLSAIRGALPGAVAGRDLAPIVRRERSAVADAVDRSHVTPEGSRTRTPASLDALGILSIAIWFPSSSGYPAGIVLMTAAIAVAVVLRRARVRKMWPYLAFSGTLSWIACYIGGIQPALALVPIVPFLAHRPRGLDLFADDQKDGGPAPGRFEQVFRLPVQIVLLFFGLVNGGVVLAKEMPGAWGVLMAALVGRPIGILVAVGLATAMGLRVPEHLRWRELIVVSLSASAGFAFALFFATAIMPPGPLLGDLKVGALSTGVGALIAFAAAWLLRVGRFAKRSTAASTLAGRPIRRHAHAGG
jgi:Na+/H+ antiporter NhaA